MKRTIFLLMVILLIGAGWIAGWFYVEGKVLQAMDATTSRLASQGRDVDCTQRATYGFPFRIGLNCQTFAYQDKRSGLSLKTRQLKTVAQAYQPNRILTEITDPLLLELPNGEALNIQWKSMRGSATIGFSGPDKFSVAGTDLTILPTFQAAAPSQIEVFQVHGRKQNEDDVQLALRIRGLDSELITFPVFDADVTVSLFAAYTELVRRPDVLAFAEQNGLSGILDGFRYSPEPAGYLDLSGPYEIDRAGLLTGTFELKISDGPQVFKTLAQGLPQYAEQIEQAGKALAVLGKANGSREVSLPLTVKRGQISIGIIPIGKIGPLF